MPGTARAPLGSSAEFLASTWACIMKTQSQVMGKDLKARSENCAVDSENRAHRRAADLNPFQPDLLIAKNPDMRQ